MLLLIVIFNSENEKTNKENIFDQDTVEHRLSRLSSPVLVSRNEIILFIGEFVLLLKTFSALQIETFHLQD